MPKKWTNWAGNQYSNPHKIFRPKSEDEEKRTNFAPKEGQSEFGPNNPIWMIIPILNLAINIVLDMFEIFVWLFKNIF